MDDEHKSREQLIEEIKQLRNNFDCYKFLFDNAPLSYISIDEDGKVIKANKTWIEYFGYESENVSGYPFEIFIAPEYIDEFRNFLANFKEEGIARDIEFEMLKKDGSRVLVSINGKIVYDTSGKFKKGHLILKDIKERKKVIEAITASRQRLYSLLEELPAYVCVYGPDLSIKFVNRYLRENFDLADGKSCYKIFHGYEDNNQEPCLSCPVLNVFKTKKIQISERKQINGKTYQIYDFPFIDYDGSLLTVEMGIDITERKKIQEELQENENKLKGIFAAAPIGIGLLRNQNIEWCNKRMCDITGYDFNSLINCDTRIFYEDQIEYNRIGELLKSNQSCPIEIETKWKRKDGTFFDCQLRSSPLNPLDQSKGNIITIMDITDRKKAQLQLEENLQYIAFLIDHIRNPLSIISGYAELKIKDEKMHNRILNQVDKIEDLIQGLDKGWIDTEDTKEFLKSFM